MSLTSSLTSRVRREDVAWKVVSTGSGIVGGIATRKLLDLVWGTVTSGREDPPLNPADRRISWPEAISWAVAAGVGVGIGRLVSQRLAAAGWERATGSPPPGVET